MARTYMNLADVYGAVDRDKNNAMQMQNMQLQQDRFQRQNQQEDRAYQEAESLKSAYRNNITPDGTINEDKLIPDLYKINPEKAAERQEKTSKRKIEEGKADLEKRKGTFAYMRDVLSTVKDDAGWQQFKSIAAQLSPELAATAPDAFDPEWQKSNLMTADKAIEQLTPKYERVDVGGKIEVVDMNPVTNPSIKGTKFDKTLTPDQIASNAIQIRGQNMTSDRASEANALKSEENNIKRGEKIPENSTAIRKEFDDLPEVKNYKAARTAYKSIEDAVPRNTTASDINIVYGIAKLYDPTSVVREGEYATVANSPNIPEKIKGMAQYLSNGGRLTDKVKQDILAEAKSRISAYEGEYLPQRKNYEDLAKRSNADPSLIFPSEFDPAVKPKTVPKLALGTKKNGYTYKGGPPDDEKSWVKDK